MEKEKQKILEAKGWKVTSVKEFLELSDEEDRTIELRLILSNALKKRRLESNLSQETFADIIHSSQSRVAKMEAGDPSVSFDLLIRSLFKTGVDRKKLSKIIATS